MKKILLSNQWVYILSSGWLFKKYEVVYMYRGKMIRYSTKNKDKAFNLWCSWSIAIDRQHMIQ